MRVVEDSQTKEPSVEKTIRIGMDTSKSFFQLHGVDAAEEPVLRKKLRRRDVLSFFAKLEPTVVGMEACGGAHHWGRELRLLGHEVKLLPAQYVKAYVKRGKNDAADAEAVCEAMSRPSLRGHAVPVKTPEQQAGLMLIGVREQLIGRRTQLTNAIRGYAAEFGLVVPRGLDKIEALIARIAIDETLPALARELFAVQARDYRRLEASLKEIDAKLMAWHRQNPMSRNLAEIPGVGPIGSTMAVLKLLDPERFRSGRLYAAWVGLTPKDHSTAGKTRLGVITHAGDEALRSVLVSGAMAVIRQAQLGRGNPSPWIVNLLKRKPPKLAAVALANKNARIIWKLMRTGEIYDAGRDRPVAAQAA
jgi:transposase